MDAYRCGKSGWNPKDQGVNRGEALTGDERRSECGCASGLEKNRGVFLYDAIRRPWPLANLRSLPPCAGSCGASPLSLGAGDLRTPRQHHRVPSRPHCGATVHGQARQHPVSDPLLWSEARPLAPASTQRAPYSCDPVRPPGPWAAATRASLDVVIGSQSARVTPAGS